MEETTKWTGKCSKQAVVMLSEAIDFGTCERKRARERGFLTHRLSWLKKKKRLNQKYELLTLAYPDLPNAMLI